jgi:uncharacterized protein (TIGR03083 family)
MNTWDMIRSERASLSDALATIPESDWSKPSLCDEWTVRDVVAHMIATAQMSSPMFFGKMAISGFNFQTMTGKEIRRVSAGRSNPELIGAYRSLVDAHTAPPGPALTWLGETIVHGEDIFRAIDGYREHPTNHVIAVADFYKGSNLMTGAKGRIAGVTLKATDADWIHGAGPVAIGPAIALVMVMTGRRAAFDDLSGDGVAVLRERLTSEGKRG